MISTSSAFTTGKAGLRLKPIHVLEIEKAARFFPPDELPDPLDEDESAIFMPTLAYEIQLEFEDPPTNSIQRGTIDGVTAQTGHLSRFQSSPLGNALDPGRVYWNTFDALPIDPSRITRIYAVMDIDFNQEDGGLAFQYAFVTFDGRAGFNYLMNGVQHGKNYKQMGSVDVAHFKTNPEDTEFSIGHEATISSGVLTGDDIAQMYVNSMGLIIYYSDPVDNSDGDTLDPTDPLTGSIIFTNRRNSGIPGALPWINDMGEQTTTVSELDGGAELGELPVTIQDMGRAITATFPDFVWEGKIARVKTGFLGMDYEDYATLFTGAIDTVSSTDDNQNYVFTLVDNKQLLSKVIYTTGDDGFATDGDHIRTLNGHPLDMVIAILQDEVGYADEEIDIAKLEQYRDSVFAGVQMQFRIDSPPAAKEFIEQQLLRPLGGWLWTNNLGKLSVNFLYPLSTSAVIAFNEDNLKSEIPDVTQVELHNVVSFRFDKNDEGKYMAEAVHEDSVSVTKYAQYGQVVIESDGARSSLQGFFMSALTAALIFLRYGRKTVQFEEITAIWHACVGEPGDIATITHENVPDREAGTLGITNKKFILLDRTWDWQNCVVKFLAMDASFLDSFGQYKIAPDDMDDYAAASAEDKARYMFLSDNDDKYSNDDDAHILG